MCVDVKQRVYFFRWGMTTEISLISRRMGSFPLAGAEPFEGVWPFVPVAGRLGTPSSRRRFLEAGSELDSSNRPQMYVEMALKSSLYSGPAPVI